MKRSNNRITWNVDRGLGCILIALHFTPFALSLFSISIRAQENPLRPPTLAFCDTSFNKIVFPGGQKGWDRYHGKLDSLFFLGIGQVNIAHFGGSHIQADIWSMELRERLQNVVPGVNGGRGFIFPYAMARTNNPNSYLPRSTGSWTSLKNTMKTDRLPLGISGYAVTTTDSVASLKLGFQGGHSGEYRFNRIKVFHRMDSSHTVRALDPDTTIRIERTTNSQDGYTEFRFDRYRDTLYLLFERTSADQRGFTLHGISLETDDPGFIHHANGVNGASTASWLRCERFTTELAVIRPDLVIFSIGINDAHDPDFSADVYEHNYDELIARVRQAAPEAAILLTTNTDSYVKLRTPNRHGGTVRDVMMHLATRHGCGVWDTFGVMGGPRSILDWEEAGFAKKDRVHLTRPGYVALGDLLFSAMMKAYGDHLRMAHRP